MELSLPGRVALVTGASRGIGRAIALAMAQAGADVAVNYRRDAEAAQATVAEIRAFGRRAEAYCASVENWDEDVRLIDQVAADFGSIGILVNNAGVASRGQLLAESDPGEVERMLRIHTLAPFYLSKLALPHLRRQARSDILMMSSTVTLNMSARGGPYAMGKAAVEALALTLAKEEREHGVRVNILAPWLTVTEMGRRLAKAWGAADIHDLDASSPFGRVCLPEDVAATAVWLVSEANPYVSGQKINIHGGG
jgi:NAD(P)-dependent dehydrogenase (short-subunit alcohol dehydrogenase family)